VAGDAVRGDLPFVPGAAVLPARRRPDRLLKTNFLTCAKDRKEKK
jgi:hypothetical protein